MVYRGLTMGQIRFQAIRLAPRVQQVWPPRLRRHAGSFTHTHAEVRTQGQARAVDYWWGGGGRFLAVLRSSNQNCLTVRIQIRTKHRRPGNLFIVPPAVFDSHYISNPVQKCDQTAVNFKALKHLVCSPGGLDSSKPSKCVYSNMSVQGVRECSKASLRGFGSIHRLVYWTVSLHKATFNNCCS